MQTDEITSLKARIVRLEEVNELLVKALKTSEKYVEGFTKFFQNVTHLHDSDMGSHRHNVREIYSAQSAANTLAEFDRMIGFAKDNKKD